MKDLHIEEKTFDDIKIMTNRGLRGAIGKVFTADGWQDFYRPIDFKTDFSTSERMLLQQEKTFLKAQTPTGSTVLPVSSTTGFNIGQEVTIDDGDNIERAKITGISGSNLIVTPIKHFFKLNAIVARSTAVTSNKLSYDSRKTYKITIS